MAWRPQSRNSESPPDPSELGARPSSLASRTRATRHRSSWFHVPSEGYRRRGPPGRRLGRRLHASPVGKGLPVRALGARRLRPDVFPGPGDRGSLRHPPGRYGQASLVGGVTQMALNGRPWTRRRPSVAMPLQGLQGLARGKAECRPSPGG